MKNREEGGKRRILELELNRKKMVGVSFREFACKIGIGNWN